MDTLEWVRRSKIIVIARGLKAEHMIGLAEALYAGGIELMEVTFDRAESRQWSVTAEAISALSIHMRGKMLIGAGTVLTEEQLEIAANAGARYIVAPNTDTALIRKVKERGLSAFPGAFTPTEIDAAYEAGADAVKIFPACSLGSSYIKMIKAPLRHVPFLAFGGIDENNAADYIAAGCCGVGVGSRLVNAEWIEAGEWSRITEMAVRFRKAVG